MYVRENMYYLFAFHTLECGIDGVCVCVGGGGGGVEKLSKTFFFIKIITISGWSAKI